MDIRTRAAWGLPAEPWAAHNVRTADGAHVRLFASAAADAGAMVWILGKSGLGKSHAVRDSFGALDAHIVEPIRLDKERLTMGDIQTRIIRSLSDEKVWQSGEARSGQTARILGEARRPVVLLIDDAHVLHPQTVRGLKRLREIGWKGRRAPLLGIVLVGQSDSAKRIPEVALRSDRYTLAGLTADEAVRATDQAINGDRQRIVPAGLQAIANARQARNWLTLQDLVDGCLAEALAMGADQVDAKVVRAALGSAPAEPVAAGPAGDDTLAAHLRKSAAA